jgi:hypothetical protein
MCTAVVAHLLSFLFGLSFPPASHCYSLTYLHNDLATLRYFCRKSKDNLKMRLLSLNFHFLKKIKNLTFFFLSFSSRNQLTSISHKNKVQVLIRRSCAFNGSESVRGNAYQLIGKRLFFIFKCYRGKKPRLFRRNCWPWCIDSWNPSLLIVSLRLLS